MSKNNSNINNKVKTFVSEIAAFLSRASESYRETQETLEYILQNVNIKDQDIFVEKIKAASSIVYDAAKEVETISRAVQRTCRLLGKILTTDNRYEIEKIYLKQLSQERTKVELAIKKIRECQGKIIDYKNEIELRKIFLEEPANNFSRDKRNEKGESYSWFFRRYVVERR